MPKTIFDKAECADHRDDTEIMDALIEFDDEYSEFIPNALIFGERVSGIMSRKGWNSKIFKDKTLLSDKDYSVYITNQTELPSFSKAFAICIGLDVPCEISVELFLLAGHSFTHEKLKRAHFFALQKFKGRIDKANDYIAKFKERERIFE